MLAPLDLSYFQALFAKLDIGPRGVVFLRRFDDGRLVMRSPQLASEVNMPLPASHPIFMAMQAGKAESLDRYVAFTDGVSRISGTVAIKGYPFFLTVAVSEDDVLASWRRLALSTAATWIVGLALMLVLVWRLWRTDQERSSLEAQLRESQRIESIGTLAGGIARDFTNILAAIQGNVALAREEIGPDHVAQASLEQIRNASTRARDLVRQILAFGRRQPHALVSQPLQPLIEESLALLRSTLPAAVVLEGQLAPQPLYVQADATHMQQVMMNLCTNAWHALQGRPGHIVLGLELIDVDALNVRDLNPGRYAHVWVRDEGVGMDTATRARIFEPFFTTKPTGQGTGLGLSVVHCIVAEHRGAIRIDSALGHGTTVHLYFPASEPGPPVLAEARAAPALAPGVGQHVVYVDDDEVVALMVERLLIQCGYRVTAFSQGRDAVAAIQTQPDSFSLVVTDFNMPGFSAIEVAQAVAAIRADLPVVISSGYISEELRSQASQVGVRAVMQKQNTLEELPRLIRAIVGR